jgi:hypothetical protein
MPPRARHAPWSAESVLQAPPAIVLPVIHEQEGRMSVHTSIDAVQRWRGWLAAGAAALVVTAGAAAAPGANGVPTAPKSPTTAQVLASMSSAARQYVKAIMSLTHAQLAAGAAGSP